MNNDSTRKRRVQKTLGLHYSRFYLIARCIDSLFRRKILENRSSAAPVEKVGLAFAITGVAMADYIDRHFIALMQEIDARIERCVILDRFARRAAPASPRSG